MKKLVHLKKDRGIALIISLFFLVILFAIGTTLLFRAQLNKKISTALTDGDLEQIKVESSLGIIENTISFAMRNNESTTFNNSFASSSSDPTVLQDEKTLRSSGRKSNASDLNTYNSTSGNVIGGVTGTGFKFHHDGEDLSGIANVEWLVYDSQGNVIDQTNPDLDSGEKGFRLAYLIIDQTGKINPNTAITANAVDEGIPYETFFKAEATPYSLEKVLEAGTDISEIRSFTEGGLFRDLTDMTSKAESAFTSATNRSIIEENFYPYGVTVQYPEIPVDYGPTQPSSYPQSRFNLHSIYDGTAFSEPLTEYKKDDDKLDELIAAIPFLKNLEDEDSAARAEEPSTYRYADMDFDGVISTDSAELADDVTVARKVAANLKDYIDNDLIATTNFQLNADGSVPDWPASGAEDFYCGHEGISISAASFYIDAFSASNNFQDYYPFFTRSNSRKLTVIKPFFEVTVDLDLGGEKLDLQDVNPNWNPAGKDDKHPLLIYHAYTATFNVARGGNPTDVGKPKIDSPDYNLEFEKGFTKDLEMVSEVFFSPRALSDRPFLSNEWPGGNIKILFGPFASNWPKAEDPWGKSRDDGIAGRGLYYTQTTDIGAGHLWGRNPRRLAMIDAGVAEGNENTSHPKNWLTPMYDPEVDSGVPTTDTDLRFTSYDIVLEFKKPLILFFDIDGDRMPDKEEIVDIVRLPSKTVFGNSSDGFEKGGTSMHKQDFFEGGTAYDREAESAKFASLVGRDDTESSNVRFHLIGDPRDNTHPNKWTQYYTKDPAGSGKFYYEWDRLTDRASQGLWLGDPTDGGERNNHMHYIMSSDFYRGWSYRQRLLDPSTAPDKIVEHGYFVPNPDQSSYLSKEDLTLTYKNPRFGTTDHEPFFNGTDYEPIDSVLKISTFSHPFIPSAAADKKFGGIRSLTELGRISRGQDWRTIKLTRGQFPTAKLISSTPSTYKDFEDPDYTPKYSGEDEEAQTINSNNPSFNTGDARLLNEVYIEYDPTKTAARPIPGFASNERFSTRDALSIHSPINPNTDNTASLKALIASVKVPYKSNDPYILPLNNRQEETDPYFSYSQNYEKMTEVSSTGDSARSFSVSQAKLDQFMVNFEAQLNSAKTSAKAPFPRAYTFSHNQSTDESFNPLDIRRLGSSKWGQVFNYASSSGDFSDPTKFSPFNDTEQETLFMETKKFVSIRFHHFSAIVLYEPLQFIPQANSPRFRAADIVSIADGYTAKVKSHIRLRAELVHDLYTNTTKVLDYKILN